MDLVNDRGEEITEKIGELDGWIKGYSFHSKSRTKAGYATDRGCLSHALNYAKKPIDALSEPEILTVRKACKIMDFV
jgi:hypothetical protein